MLHRLYPLVYLGILLLYALLVLPDVTSQNLDLTHHLRNIGVITLLFVFLHAQSAGTTASDGEPTVAPSQPARRMLAVAGLVVMAMLGVGVVNYIVNPFGLYPTDNFEPVVVNSRNLKADLYEATSPTPEIVVLGSSRSIPVDPAYIEAQTGQPAFNAAVTGGVPRDFLAFLRFMLALDKAPQTFIVGLSVDQLTLDYVPLEPDRLAPYVAADSSIISDVIYQADNLFSLQQAEASVSSLLREREGLPDAPEYITFEANSMGYFNDPRPLDEAVAETLSGWIDYFDGKDLNPTAMNYLRLFLESCQQHDIDVVIYIAPYHPAVIDVLDEEYERLQAAYLEVLAGWQAELDFTVYDFSDPASAGITGAMFYDAGHPNPDGNQQILNAIFDDL